MVTSFLIAGNVVNYKNGYLYLLAHPSHSVPLFITIHEKNMIHPYFAFFCKEWHKNWIVPMPWWCSIPVN